jgi:hypothetical protein
MSLFHSLRSSHKLARLALLWFALTLGAAVATPVIHPQEELVVCSGVGLQKVLVNADGSVSSSTDSGISCPLCLIGGAPPPATLHRLAAAHTTAHALPATQAAPIKARSATPPPARGPPQA